MAKDDPCDNGLDGICPCAVVVLAGVVVSVLAAVGALGALVAMLAA